MGMRDLTKARMRDLMRTALMKMALMRDLMRTALMRAPKRVQKRDRMRHNNIKVMVIERKYFKMDPITGDLWMGIEHSGQLKSYSFCISIMSTIANNCTTYHEFDIEIKIEF